MSYIFTTNWFEDQRRIIEEYIPVPDPNQSVAILEIGAFEGRSTTYFIDKFLTHPESRIDVIDPFNCQDDTTPVTPETIRRFLFNISNSKYPFKFAHLKGPSSLHLPILQVQNAHYDYIFIDGSHHKEDVLYDAVNAFSLLKSGGILFFDDYGAPEPQCAIEAFKTCFNAHFEIIHQNYHLILRKL